ncbi:hypothetical protein ACSU64_04635 [Bacillaceae bacterium C204]|uniref:hypothetical protein n=1 Tax=Neobacillus sp. 204 TaxID=3383351 RepID=UPI00397A4076
MLEEKFKELSCDDDGGIVIGLMATCDDGGIVIGLMATCDDGGIVIGPMSANEPVSIDFAIQGEKIGSAFAESNPGQPTDFTSWGTTSDLLLKPEIMAPGHAIMSSVRTSDPNQHNGYESEDKRITLTSKDAKYARSDDRFRHSWKIEQTLWACFF